MFAERVSGTKFTGEVADAIFPQITQVKSIGNIEIGDDSLITTLRCLFGNKIGDEERLEVFTGGYRTREIGNVADNVRVIEDFVSSNQRDGVQQLFIFGVTGDMDEEVIERIKEKNSDQCSLPGEYVRLKRVEAFLQKHMNAACLIDKKNKRTVLVVEKITMARFHGVQSGLMALLPWLFDSNERGVQLSEIQQEFIFALAGSSAEDYRQLVSKCESMFDFRAKEIEVALSGFEKEAWEVELAEIDRRNAHRREQMLEYRRQINSLIKEIEENNTKHLGLKQRILSEEGGEVMRYFVANKNLNVLSNGGGDITFSIQTTLNMFDQDIAESFLRSYKSNYFKGLYDRLGEDDSVITELLERIFLKEQYSMRTIAVFNINRHCSWSPMQGSFGDGGGGMPRDRNDLYKEVESMAIANPHIGQYGCAGSYRSEMDRAQDAGDHIGLISLMQSSASNLNLTDSTVCEWFFRHMGDNPNLKFIEDAEGNVYSVKELCEIIKAESMPVTKPKRARKTKAPTPVEE